MTYMKRRIAFSAIAVVVLVCCAVIVVIAVVKHEVDANKERERLEFEKESLRFPVVPQRYSLPKLKAVHTKKNDVITLWTETNIYRSSAHIHVFIELTPGKYKELRGKLITVQFRSGDILPNAAKKTLVIPVDDSWRIDDRYVCIIRDMFDIDPDHLVIYQVGKHEVECSMICGEIIINTTYAINIRL
ncbi:MAG TPA: hypothetical protein VGJ05_00355 [Fimbriiglobus sp.]